MHASCHVLLSLHCNSICVTLRSKKQCECSFLCHLLAVAAPAQMKIGLSKECPHTTHTILLICFQRNQTYTRSHISKAAWPFCTISCAHVVPLRLKILVLKCGCCISWCFVVNQNNFSFKYSPPSNFLVIAQAVYDTTVLDVWNENARQWLFDVWPPCNLVSWDFQATLDWFV